MIAEFESRILALIDDVRWNTPVMMSCSPGYLRGHHTLAVAELEAGDDHSAEAIHDEVSRSSKSHPWQARLPRDQSLWFWECGTTCSSRLK
ncbi:YfcL family protein [Enterobacter cloacae subsp. cloacae]|nr:YfcL family protein [Enterobacter cloacae subsp. cloacae]